MEHTGEEEMYKEVCGAKDCDKVLDINTPIFIWGRVLHLYHANEKTEEEITTCGDCGDDLDTDEFRSLGWTRDDDEDRREEEEKGLKNNTMENQLEIETYKNVDFYNDSGGFMTVSDFIASYQDHEQEFFNVICWHDKDATPYDIEKSILRNAISTVGFKDEQEDGLAHELVKLSSCTWFMEKYKKKEADNIDEFTSRQNGKWYFQPDQRCEIVNTFIQDDPRIACDVMSYRDWLISEGLDPDQEHFNRILIDCFNSERIDEFKERFYNIIERTFGDVIRKKGS